MNSRESKELYKYIATELGVTELQIEEACKSPFVMQHYVQTKVADKTTGDIPSVRIPYFGIFYKDQRRMSFYLTKSKKNKQDESI